MRKIIDFFIFVFSLILWGIWWLSAIVLIDLDILLSLIIPRKYWNYLVKITCSILTYCVFIFPRLKGINPKDIPFPVIYVANHVSFFDLFISGTILPGNPRGLELAHHFKLPFYGWFLCRFGQIPINIGSKKSIRKSFLDMINILINKERSILIMPEGQRTKNGKLGKFKTGAFYIARKANVPIVPIVFRGLYNINNYNTITIKPGVVDVVILDPINPEKFKNDDNMSEYVWKVIDKKLNE
jgi:1-acyl-sn-glycerol-3-phosphate acyltransferase